MQKELIFKKFTNYIKDGNFLLHSNDNTDKRYKLNSHGYRTQEFDDIDWKNAVVIFGCSNVYGVGLEEDETICSQLSKEIDRPVVNMGVPGSSMQYSLYNSVILNEFYPTPYAVIQIWTMPERTMTFSRYNINGYGTWNIEKNNYMDLWSKNKTNVEVSALFCSMISKQIWESKTNYNEISFFPKTSYLLKCSFIRTIDVARDNLHPGVKTAKKTALKIKENLFKNLTNQNN